MGMLYCLGEKQYVMRKYRDVALVVRNYGTEAEEFKQQRYYDPNDPADSSCIDSGTVREFDMSKDYKEEILSALSSLKNKNEDRHTETASPVRPK